MTRVLLTLAAATLLLGCDQLLETYTTVETPTAPEVELRGGAVTWELIASDCPTDVQDLWRGQDRGYVLLERDSLELMFDTTPPMRGALVAGAATVRGDQTFMGDDGADVTCVVSGSAALEGPPAAPAAIAGEMTEALSSAGALNCSSHARYRLVLD